MPLATHLLFLLLLFIHLRRTVAKAGVLLLSIFSLSLSGVVAGVGVSLATHLFFMLLLSLFIHLCGTVAEACVPLAVHLFYQF